MIEKMIFNWIKGAAAPGPERIAAAGVYRKCFKSLRNAILVALLILPQLLHGQEGALQVTVVDREGNPLQGAQVALLSVPGAVTLTNEAGVATFSEAPGGLLRIVHNDRVKTVQAVQGVRVELDDSDRRVNLGYGNVDEPDKLTSAMDVVYADDLAKSSLHNPLESLYGQLSGLAVLQNGGEPWNRSPDMYIRGRGTYNNSAMLVLVDGFERDLASLSVREIESVAVLKDGAALAMYGQRGANGVLLVTTKQGDYNSFRVDVSLDRGMNSPFRMPEFLDGYSWARSVNEASALDGNPFVYSEWDLQDYQSGDQPSFFPSVNWLDETLREQGTMTNFNTSFSGGGSAVTYFVSLNYQNEEGLFDNTTLDERYNSQLKYDRFNFRTNLKIDLTRTTKFMVNVAGMIDGRKEPGARVSEIMNALYSVPSGAFPVESINGVWGGTEYYGNNPVALVSSTGLRQPHSRGIKADGRLVQDLGSWLPGLSAEVALAYDNQVAFWENKTRDFLYESVGVVRNPETGAIVDTTVARYGSDTDLNATDNFGGQQRHATLYGKLNYAKSWEQNELNASLLYHQEKRVNDGQYNTFLHQSLVAFAGYGYANRYFIDGVVSYSGTSVLPEGSRFGIFPSLSAGWLISREDFLAGSSVIDHMKLRASWGLSGNDRMAYNLYDQSFYSGGQYFFTDNNNGYGGIREGQLPAAGLTYEKASKFNVGLDLEMIDRLHLTAELFYELRTDILASADGSVPSLVGVDRPVSNIGEVENKGAEASMMWRDEIGSFSYHLGGIFSFARNRILEMNEDYRPYDYLRETGNPVGQQFGLESVGFFADEADIANSPTQLFSEVRPGDIKYRDQNDDDVIDALDRVQLGYAAGYPEMYFSSTVGFEFRGFGAEALFQGAVNQTLHLNTQSVFWPLRGQTSITNFSADRWTPFTAESATLPRLSLLENANNYQKNDIWLTENDYLKLRRLEVYYRFSAGMLERISMQSAKIYIRGMNLFSIDMIDVMDPEEIGVTYPTLTSWHAGISLGF
ncbi:MAG: SusC/RagA family TonB-linked outer membrane protein [Bacteroidales bacterium]|nr:SusC/RagA family TonB-linked outer membrane protein [Bacteroidales bacterium]